MASRSTIGLIFLTKYILPIGILSLTESSCSVFSQYDHWHDWDLDYFDVFFCFCDGLEDYCDVFDITEGD